MVHHDYGGCCRRSSYRHRLLAKYKYLRTHADQILRDRVVASLSARFNSPVELDSFHLDIGPTIHVTGGGLRILYLAGPTKPDANPNNPAPMISVDHFEFETNFKALLEPTTRIVTVRVSGLDLHVPPHGMGHIPRKLDNPKPQKQPKISLVFDKIICENSRLVIETTKPGKLPLVFNLSNITLTDVGASKPLLYDAVLTNARPVGQIHSTGHFGPWQADDPRDTPIDGNYSFTNADLGPSKASRASSLPPASSRASWTTSTSKVSPIPPTSVSISAIIPSRYTRSSPRSSTERPAIRR